MYSYISNTPLFNLDCCRRSHIMAIIVSKNKNKIKKILDIYKSCMFRYFQKTKTNKIIDMHVEKFQTFISKQTKPTWQEYFWRSLKKMVTISSIWPPFRNLSMVWRATKTANVYLGAKQGEAIGARCRKLHLFCT